MSECLVIITDYTLDKREGSVRLSVICREYFSQKECGAMTRVVRGLHRNPILGKILLKNFAVPVTILFVPFTSLYYETQFRCNFLRPTYLTPSSPVMSNGYTSKCSGSYWSNPPECQNVNTLKECVKPVWR